MIFLYKFHKNYYFFVQGDNSNVSYDSRSFGLIPQKSIIGKGLIRFFSNKKRKDKKGKIREFDYNIAKKGRYAPKGCEEKSS